MEVLVDDLQVSREGRCEGIVYPKFNGTANATRNVTGNSGRNFNLDGVIEALVNERVSGNPAK